MVWESRGFGVLGLSGGVLGGVFGLGGGLIAIPVRGVALGLDQQMAQGTALVMVVPNVLLAVWRYHQRNRIDLRQVAALATPAFFCAILGSTWAVSLDAARMRVAFAGFLLALAVYTLVRAARRTPAQGPLRHGWPWLVPVGVLAGLTGGLFAVGGGVIAVPVLTALFGASQVVAQGLALGLAAPSTLVALVTYGWHGEVLWSVGIPLALGGICSISLGVRLAHSLPEPLLKGLYALFLVGSAILLLVKG